MIIFWILGFFKNTFNRNVKKIDFLKTRINLRVLSVLWYRKATKKSKNENRDWIFLPQTLFWSLKKIVKWSTFQISCTGIKNHFSHYHECNSNSFFASKINYFTFFIYLFRLGLLIMNHSIKGYLLTTPNNRKKNDENNQFQTFSGGWKIHQDEIIQIFRYFLAEGNSSKIFRLKIYNKNI